MTNIGIVGLGYMAVAHIRACRQIPEARIVAACNPSGRHLDGDFGDVSGNVGLADPVSLDMSRVTAYREYAAMLANPEVHLVDICAPTAAHVDLAVAALEAGKHVLCEKPMARTTVEARRMATAATTARGFFMPAMCMRFWPGWSWLKRAVEDQRYGRILAARFRRVAEPPGWGQAHFPDGVKSGGALLDLHIHDTDFVQFLFGRPRAVCSTGYSRFSGAIDHVLTQYRYDSGPLVFAEGAWTMTPGFGFHMAYTVTFELATADYDLARGADALRLIEKGQPSRTVPCEVGDGYIGEIRHLIDAITSGKPPTVVTAQDGVSAVEICEAEERSARTGQIVNLG